MRQNNAGWSTRIFCYSRMRLWVFFLVSGLGAQTLDTVHSSETALPPRSIDTLASAGGMSLPEDAGPDSAAAAKRAPEPVSVSAVNDSAAFVVMDDSTRVLVPVAGYRKKSRAPLQDNMSDYSPFNPTAFVKKKYPLTVSLTELVMVSVHANIAGSTTFSLHGLMPGLHNYQAYFLGLQQGIWSLKNDAAAIAGFGLFSPRSENNPFYLHGRLVGSVRFFPRSALHFACSWTYLKYYWLNEKRTDTVDYYSRVSESTILRGLSVGLECQPFRRWKFFVDYFDYTCFLYQVLDRFPYTVGWGTRILFDRVSVDLGAALLPKKWGMTYYDAMIIPIPLPYLRISGHFGHQRE